jgi:hypothetical protein
MKRIILSTLIAGGLILAAGCTPAQIAGVKDYVSRTQTIHEDDPRWDCHTMGNRICGPAR